MIRAEQQKVIFFHNPKAAGSSINTWFLTNIPGSRHVEPQHIQPNQIDHVGYWSFCVVRNPWDRWVSWWCFWHDKLKRIDTPFDEYTLRYFSGDYVGMSGGEHSPLFQQHAIADAVDCVLHYENLTEDFRIVQEKLSCYATIPHTNSSRGRKHYTEYYTSKQLIDVIAANYEQDIEKYGYEYAV